MARAKKTIHFLSLGCPKNRVDSEVMLGVAEREGYRHVDDADAAEVIVINTCGFIGEAKKESIDAIFEMAEKKESGSCKRLVVAGCLSQRHPNELALELPEVDNFLGSSDMLKLGEVLRGKAQRMLVGNPAEWLVEASSPRRLSTPSGSAYVKLAEGCDRTCSFCVIPALRGGQRSRAIEDVVREVEGLVAQGVREVNLVSQDTVAYGRDRSPKVTLAEVARRVADVPGIHWARLFYLYPETLTDELVDLIAGHERIVKYIDMPLQHVADAMLRRMRRGHGGARIRRVVDRLRERIPGLTFRSAFIVGHPGETDAEFQELCDFVSDTKLDRVGVFRFSDEETAASYAMPNKVPPLVIANRWRRLMAIQRRISHQKSSALVGQTLEVLVEGQSDEHELVMMGRHAGQAPGIDGQVYLSGGEAFAGEIRRVEITQASDYDLVGELLDEPEARRPPARTKRVTLPLLQTDGRSPPS